MTFVRELDDLPWEVRSYGGLVYYWPKIDGVNVAANSTPGANTYEILDAGGEVLQAEAVVSTHSTVDGVSRFGLNIPALDLGERYQVRIYWYDSGAVTQYSDVRLFDVVRFPFGQPASSLNDLLEVKVDAGQPLDRLGVRLGYTTGDEAKEQAAGICAYHARLALDARVRDAIAQDRQRIATETSSPAARDAELRRRVRPALILDRLRLGRVERFEALAHLYRSLGGTTDGDDPYSRELREFREAADMAWRQVGPLAYDADDDGAPEETLTDLARATHHRRVQA